MDSERQRIIDLIKAAFRGVTLGNGIGLRQGEGLDDYADEKTLAEYRSKDERDDWSTISIEEMNCCSHSPSYFDAEGMRFHLPAFLIAELEKKLNVGFLFHLIYFEHGAISRFELLSESQRRAVREYLLFRLSYAGIDEIGFIGPTIEKALAEYWVE